MFEMALFDQVSTVQTDREDRLRLQQLGEVFLVCDVDKLGLEAGNRRLLIDLGDPRPLALAILRRVEPFPVTHGS
jgi:hypothetical protein